MPRQLFVVGMLLFIQACHDTQLSGAKNNSVVAKAVFNSQWQKSGVGPEEWYYRMTVIDAPVHAQALTVAEGHSIEPDTIRWEITKNLLIAWRTHAEIINAEHELSPSRKKFFKGAPVLAFYIYAHEDGDDSVMHEAWHERPYIKVDWSQNLVSTLKRHDQENPGSSVFNNSLNYFVDALSPFNPQRMRVSHDYIDITTRHPMPVINASLSGAQGLAYKKDAAAIVLDIRHSFLKKRASDYVPTPSPDEVLGISPSGSLKKIAINNRFGFFRTGIDGTQAFDHSTGGIIDDAIVNATLFNIWRKSRDDNGSVIPIEAREIKPVIYYMNVTHPDNLMAVSKSVIAEWDNALRSAVYYAQRGKYTSLENVPHVLLLKKNSCSIDTINEIFSRFSHAEKKQLEQTSRVNLSSVNKKLADAQNNTNFQQQATLEITAKRELERLCSALEYYTEDQEHPFIYQRLGDVRFNLINPIVDSISTPWSGYGPMFADNLCGETISATANVNLGYINKSAYKTSKKISLIKNKSPGLLAVFSSSQGPKNTSDVDENALEIIRNRMQEDFTSQIIMKKSAQSLWENYALKSSKENAFLMDIIDNKQGNNHTNKHHQHHDLFDGIEVVERMAHDVGLHYIDLDPEERFISIRASLYRSVLLHELGHNLGLRHNMAASSDALNYHSDFWQAQQLPANIEDALNVVTNNDIKIKLEQCSRRQSLVKFSFDIFSDDSITTEKCLEDKGIMSSSVMDYMSGTPIMHLGYYDKAAIKWAYTRLIEVFPKNSVAVDTEKEPLDEWIKYNDFRLIPQKLLVSYDALHQRNYQTFRWNNRHALDELPYEAVPYAYSESGDGSSNSRGLAFDVGPDMRTTAAWLENRFWNNYIFNYFSEEDYLNGSSLTTTALREDIDLLEKFSHMARWYYYLSRHDPKFKNSFLEKDYIKALAQGLNHFAVIIALPQPGAHITAPNYVLEPEEQASANDRLGSSSLLIPFRDLEDCQAKSISKLDNKGYLQAIPGFSVTKIPLGIGRPLYSRATNFNENNHIKYVGSSLIKKLVLYYLSAPLEVEKSILGMRQDESFVSWYKLFPEAVGKIYNSVINHHYEDIAFEINDRGQLELPTIIDEMTLSVNHQPKNLVIKPGLDGEIAQFALTTALSFIPGALGDDDGFAQSLKITCQGCADDVNYAPAPDNFAVKNFTHFSGYTFKALSFPEKESVGATLLKRAEQQKEHVQRLHNCIKNNDTHLDPLCQCIKTTARTNGGQWSCCEAGNKECAQATLEDMGSETCSLSDLVARYNQVKEQLDATVTVINYMRTLSRQR